MKAKMEPTRKPLRTIANQTARRRVVCLASILAIITISDSHAGKPKRKRRWASMGIAEQSGASAAGGWRGKESRQCWASNLRREHTISTIWQADVLWQFDMLMASARDGGAPFVGRGPRTRLWSALADGQLPTCPWCPPCNAHGRRKAAACCCSKDRSVSLTHKLTPVCAAKRDTVALTTNMIRLRTRATPKRSKQSWPRTTRANTRISASWPAGPMAPEAMRSPRPTFEKEFGYETRVLNLHTLEPNPSPRPSFAPPRTRELSSPPKSIRSVHWPGESAAS